MHFTKELQTEIELQKLRKENGQLKKKLEGKIQARRKTTKEKVLDTTIRTPTAIHHFYQKERKNIEYELKELTYNGERILFGRISDIWASLEFYGYQNNQKYFYIALNGKVMQFSKFEMRKLLSLTMKAGRHLGVLGRKNGKKPKTVNR